MPGTEGDSPDELDALLAETETNASEEANSTLDVLKPTQSHGEDPQGSVRKGSGEAGAPRNWEAEYKKLRQEMDRGNQKRNEKLRQFDEILKNPKLAKYAATDKELGQALAKVGFKQAEQAYEEEAEGEGEMDPVMFEVQVLRAEMAINSEISDLREELGRKLSPEEVKEIKGWIQKAGSLSVKEAWRLTKSYEKEMLAKQDKRISEATKKLAPKRPLPNPQLAGSSKMDMTKPVTQMNDAERQAKIREIIEQNQ